jgi:hypothetical protein
MLPIGVVIPTRNSVLYLPRHVASLREWIPQVHEVVVVDSFSQDSTLELLRAQLHHPRLRFVSRPPGLYQSWNYAIQRLNAHYTYVATVGDSITLPGLLHLFEAAERFQSDVILSPPVFQGLDGKDLHSKQWTIHRYLRAQATLKPTALPGSHLFLTSVFAGASGMMGSSASNLYRTATLKARPFPTEYGHVGDTAWGVAHAFEIRAVLTPERCARFLLHPNAGQVTEAQEIELEGKLMELARATLRESLLRQLIPAAAGSFWAIMAEYERLHRQAHTSDSAYYRYRSGRLPWFLHARAWRARRARNRFRAAAERLWRGALAEFSF